MKLALISFLKELDDLEKFLEATRSEGKLVDQLVAHALGTDKSEDDSELPSLLEIIKSNSSLKRKQVYFSSVITLYGALERFVEEAVKEYVDQLVEIFQNYQNLPDEIRDKHIKLSIEYLSSMNRSSQISSDEFTSAVKNLNNCLIEQSPFRLNARAFSLRSANMKFDRIRQIMSNLKIQFNLDRILDTSKFSDFVIKRYGESSVKSGGTHLLNRVNELVDLRNDIAHGNAKYEPIEKNIDWALERSAELKCIAEAINDIMTHELTKHSADS